MKLAPVLFASILSLTTLSAWGAAPADDVYSVKVQFADLDLDREAGIAKLFVRIKGAARRVCDEQASDPGVKETYPVCVKRALSTAVARLNRPRLSEYVAQFGGEPVDTAPASVAAR